MEKGLLLQILGQILAFGQAAWPPALRALARAFGLAMCRGGRRPDQAGEARAGPSEQRAPKRSARRRREAPKLLH
ncbi:hypothetical protein SGRA_3990 [Saprospira grandis str. Lewin]|uniref:Uncharacterized protein n=1 Tax=Saprospira grandis (strain Lewin) TaxID=984262 RepID=H6L8I0_SAPGL|nr:hypothetical protein SGRA_3990 [Saprospira grandis str. Lewin]